MAAPPPARRICSSKLKRVYAILNDAAHLEQVRQDAAASIWYDSDSPSTRRRREVARADFEYVVKSILGKQFPYNIAARGSCNIHQQEALEGRESASIINSKVLEHQEVQLEESTAECLSAKRYSSKIDSKKDLSTKKCSSKN